MMLPVAIFCLFRVPLLAGSTFCWPSAGAADGDGVARHRPQQLLPLKLELLLHQLRAPPPQRAHLAARVQLWLQVRLQLQLQLRAERLRADHHLAAGEEVVELACVAAGGRGRRQRRQWRACC
jgi:hypothetical protein